MANNTLRLNGEISSYQVWRVNQFLSENKGKPVTVRLASPGGDVASAVQISSNRLMSSALATPPTSALSSRSSPNFLAFITRQALRHLRRQTTQKILL